MGWNANQASNGFLSKGVFIQILHGRSFVSSIHALNKKYVITIKNNTGGVIPNVKIGDVLPSGFRYAKNSSTVNGVKMADPAIAGDGRTLNFSIGNIAGAATITLKYVAEVTVGAKTGKAENIAFAITFFQKRSK